jgi:hypothetical protein
MKKKLVMASSVLLMLMSIVLVSGCSQKSQNLGYDYYADDMFKMVPAEKHEEKFPKGHLKDQGDDADKQCFHAKGTPAYFCQFWAE